jgi:glycosyltransferase involved in cell wall biosynthesis
MPKRRFRVLAVATHPVQYQVPLFRRMAARDELDLRVAYCTLRGAEPAHDAGFGATVQWDVPLLDGYSWVEVPNRGSGTDAFLGLCNPGLWKLICEGRFDAVLCYVGYVRATFWIAYFAAKSSGTAFLFGTDATTLTSVDRRMWKRSVKRVVWPMVFRLADHVSVPSTGGRELMRLLGLPDERVTLTPYVVDNDWWLAQAARVDRAAVRASWGAAADDAVILFCAKLQAWKRPLDLLQAFAKANIGKTLLVFAGEGPLRGQLESEAAALGVAGRVRFLGFVNQTQLPKVYTAADLMVLPSAYEPFGVVVNEAMLCGCPVIVSERVGAARDLVAEGRTGFVYPCADVAALVPLLERLLADRDKLRALGEAARKRMETWGPRENIDATLETISRGVSRVGSARGRGRRADANSSSADADSAASAPQKLPE